MAEILGSGIAFPLQVDRRGGMALAHDETDVDQAIQLILSTAPGERPMRPEFGCGVHDFVFDTIDATTVARMEEEIRSALDRWEPRIEVLERGVRPGGRRPRRARDLDRLPAAVHQPHPESRLPVLRHPCRGRGMRLPEIQLDDRRFQDLVSEARLKIHRACPEWTEHNVSDPGITLIELFAWMTEMTIYRLNRVPDKLHVALLELLGIRLDGPSAARTDVRFRLAAPATESVAIPGGDTEVATPRTPNEESIVFQVDEDFVIPPARPNAYVVQRSGQVKDVGVADGTARPTGPDQVPFGSPPAVGDALYLGFEEPLGRLLMQIDVDASQARGAGVNPEDPPLRWEVSQGDGVWTEAEVLEDLTGGFNYGSGTVELQLPPRSAIQPLAGHRCHWLRCRIDDRTRHGGAATTYSHAPEVYAITAAPIGALLPSTHAARVEREIVGTSDGTPGQVHPLRHQPVLKPGPGETLEVQDPESGDWSTWEKREDFVGSTEFDRHFALDPVSGDVEFGPAIRETDGGWTQYGAVPPKGAVLRFARYRYGGGRRGNVTAGALSVLRSAIPGVDTVGNPRPAVGGVDAEPLSHARQRASMEIRTRYRAVTADDFEFLAGEASPRVARAVCLPPTDGGPVGAAHRPARGAGRPPARLRRAGAGRRAAHGGRRVPRRAAPDRHDGAAPGVPLPRAVRGGQPAGLADGRHRARRGGRLARALHVPQPARRRLGHGLRRGLAVRPRAQPGRALRRRPRRRGRRVREDPARLRDQPRDGRAVGAAGRLAHRARAGRAARVRRAHRAGHAPGGMT